MIINRYIALFFLILHFCLSSPAQESPPIPICSVTVAAAAESDPDRLVKQYFPSAKPFTRASKAYIWWRSRSQSPDAAFDVAVMEKGEREAYLVKVGGYFVGEKIIRQPFELPKPEKGLGPVRQKLMQEHYQGITGLLRTTSTDLAYYKEKIAAIETKLGSMDKMLKEKGVSLEMTPEKQAQLNSAETRNDGGLYMIDSRGKIYFLSYREIRNLEETLGIDDIKHGMMGAILLTMTGNKELQILDYGKILVYPGATETYQLISNQEGWNRGHVFKGLEYLLGR